MTDASRLSLDHVAVVVSDRDQVRVAERSASHQPLEPISGARSQRDDVSQTNGAGALRHVVFSVQEPAESAAFYGRALGRSAERATVLGGVARWREFTAVCRAHSDVARQFALRRASL